MDYKLLLRLFGLRLRISDTLTRRYFAATLADYFVLGTRKVLVMAKQFSEKCFVQFSLSIPTLCHHTDTDRIKNA